MARVWSATAMQLGVTEFMRGLPWMVDFLGRLLPPNVAVLPRLMRPALPFAFLGARNLTPQPLVRLVVRQTFNVARGINELILALLFVALVGLGPFPGVLALAFHGG